jgi:hypothetical protein
VERRNVTLGVTTANQAEILSGLRDGEQVIIANQASFQPGELVTPKPSALASINASEAKYCHASPSGIPSSSSCSAWLSQWSA